MSPALPPKISLENVPRDAMSPVVMTPSLKDLDFLSSEAAARDNKMQVIRFVGRWLAAHGYKQALSCLRLLDELKHDDMRDDGETPAIMHELSQASYAIAFIEAGYRLPDPEAILCLNFIHDLGEEKSLTPQILLERFARDGIKIGDREKRIAEMGLCISKRLGERKLYESDAEYFKAQLQYPETAFAKGLDRSNNMGTLIGVRTLVRQNSYTMETATYVRPMLEKAARLYPEYTEAFGALNQIIGLQTFFSNQFEMAAKQQELGVIRALPVLKKLPLLPAGLDPLHIAQTRARSFLNRAPG